MKRKELLIILTSLILSASVLTGCGKTGVPSNGTTASTSISKNDGKLLGTGTYFDTVIGITLYDTSKEDLINHCFDMAAHYEEIFSRTKDTSDVSRINAAKGESVEVDPETIALIEYGLKYGDLSDGRFDITIGELSDLWDISNNPGNIPDQTDIDTALSTVDYTNIKIDGYKVSLKNPDAMLDLGGIAKGYIADKMKEYLVSEGITSGMINLGGNVLTIGVKPDGDSYAIGIQKPFDSTNASIAYVKINDQTVVSSGVYERYFKKDEKLYHHILDTSTGYPIENDLYGVTIITDDSVDGDALSTTVFALGIDDGMKLIESMVDTEAVFITENMDVLYTSGLEDNLTMLE